MTMGDVLAAIAGRQQASQPLEAILDETRGSLDAMLEFGSDELDEVMYELASELRSVERNTSSALSEQLGETEEAMLRQFDERTAPLRSEAAAEREAIEAIAARLTQLREERDAAREAEEQAERARARGRGWYGDADSDTWLKGKLASAQEARPDVLRAAQLSTSAIGLLSLLGLLSLALWPDAPEGARTAWGSCFGAALSVYVASLGRILLG